MTLPQIQAPIAADLREVDRQIEGQLRVVCQDRDFAAELFRSFFHAPGKKLRPSLMLLSAFALRQDPLRAVPPAARYCKLIALATVTELVHCASLMHDDVLDTASTRRGLPSLNATFGNRMAILAGDMLYSQAFELLASTANRRTIRLLAQCVHRMCRGEVRNLQDHDFDGYLGIIEDKTATLMALCCRMGAEAVSSGGDDAEHVAALSEFGHHFGMVYQLFDDRGDQDNRVAMASGDKVLAALADHIGQAERLLAGVPDSAYRASLALLLRHVVSKSESRADRHFLMKTTASRKKTPAGTGR